MICGYESLGCEACKMKLPFVCSHHPEGSGVVCVVYDSSD